MFEIGFKRLHFNFPQRFLVVLPSKSHNNCIRLGCWPPSILQQYSTETVVTKCRIIQTLSLFNSNIRYQPSRHIDSLFTVNDTWTTAEGSSTFTFPSWREIRHFRLQIRQQKCSPGIEVPDGGKWLGSTQHWGIRCCWSAFIQTETICNTNVNYTV